MSSRSYVRRDAAILEARNDEIARLYGLDLPHESIGKIYSLTRQRIQQILKARGVGGRTAEAWTATEFHAQRKRWNDGEQLNFEAIAKKYGVSVPIAMLAMR